MKRRKVGQFAKKTTITFTTQLVVFILSLATSILLARWLGAKGKGIYTLAALLPSMLGMLVSLGVGPATVYYVAQKRYRREIILGHNLLIALGVSGFGVVIGLIVILFFQPVVFPGVRQLYLLVALALLLPRILFNYLQNFLLGAQKIKEYNLADLLKNSTLLIFIFIAVWVFRAHIVGALIALITSWILADFFLFLWAKKLAKGASVKFKISYLKDASSYGMKVHLGNILGFLNYRIDMFLVNFFLSPTAVGFYSISVAVAEKIWMMSNAASTVLFPRVAAEEDEQKRKEFTPVVARNVLFLTFLAGLSIAFLSEWIIKLLYSTEFLPAVRPLQILLPGIIALSASRVLANDIAGRGRPMLNTYVSLVTLITNVLLNVYWIPLYGISGAALASTVSYGVTLIMRLVIYCQLSGNSWTEVVLLKSRDFSLYVRVGEMLGQWVRGKLGLA